MGWIRLPMERCPRHCNNCHWLLVSRISVSLRVVQTSQGAFGPSASFQKPRMGGFGVESVAWSEHLLLASHCLASDDNHGVRRRSSYVGWMGWISRWSCDHDRRDHGRRHGKEDGKDQISMPDCDDSWDHFSRM